jgi:hypothetical protein
MHWAAFWATFSQNHLVTLTIICVCVDTYTNRSFTGDLDFNSFSNEVFDYIVTFKRG